jgi:hybrid polyketide synthase/nonribosomal peptide synthetase ACE1
VSLYSNIIEVPYATGPNPRLSVGSTLPNYLVFIVNDESEIVPTGILGQIGIGGPGVASCYVDNMVQTKEKFVSEIPSLQKHLYGRTGTLHLSGDEGWMGADGLLYIKGRMTGDTQIKLR